MSIIIFDSIQKKETERQKLLKELLSIQAMIRGAFCITRVKCGKKYCHCQKGEGHLHHRMALYKNKTNYQRAVPKEDHVWAKEMAGNFTRCRQIQKELSKLEQEVRELLDEHVEQVTQATKEGKSYLDI